jgi:hypothetical protein
VIRTPVTRTSIYGENVLAVAFVTRTDADTFVRYVSHAPHASGATGVATLPQSADLATIITTVARYAGVGGFGSIYDRDVTPVLAPHYTANMPHHPEPDAEAVHRGGNYTLFLAV